VRQAQAIPVDWFDNHRRLRELITEFESLSLAIAKATPRWNH
jgi:hypothetical protein